MKYCKYDLINRIQWVCVIYRSMCDWIVLMTSGMSVAAKFEELQQQALKRLSDKDQNCQGSICSMVFFCCCCCFCCFGGGGIIANFILVFILRALEVNEKSEWPDV